MEEIQARHRKEQRDLVARITQKKKNATKKTRKGVLDECATLERELKERQESEIAALNGEPDTEEATDDDLQPTDDPNLEPASNGLENSVHDLSLDSNHVTNGESTHADISATAPKKRNRQKDRLARRAAEQEALVAQAAEEAANMPNPEKQEKQRMQEEFRNRGLQEKFIRPDGHCLYSAIADQLEVHQIDLKPKIPLSVVELSDDDFAALSAFKKVRSAAAACIKQNSEHYEPYLEEPVDSYVHKVKDSAEWGGHIELQALAKAYNIPINVIHGSGTVQNIEAGDDADKDKSIWLAYYLHGFGLGEHYNSLRKSP